MAPFLELVPFLELIPQEFGLWPPSWNLSLSWNSSLKDSAYDPHLGTRFLKDSAIMAPILEPLLFMTAPILEFPHQGFGRLT
ncbi:hypothetical protein TIFTF001_048379 [Ficus carica]|uniref:Uncharacterized protein n=1 Tax=Ficus carica TaxID=3494 RepID=A0AA87ZEA5_FICCA|nr:hypothetical protein TIFTF001_048376 [Ficus carica]GMN34700.1 hypothetical protein TIFTF001_048379 [Ficus carica]